MLFTESYPVRNPKIVIGTLIGLGVLGAFMAKKKAAKKTSKKTTTKAAAKKRVAKAEPTRTAGVMTSQDLEDRATEVEQAEDEAGLVHDAHGNAPLDQPTSLDEPTKL